MSRILSRVNWRATSTASSSNAHGTRYELEPCSRLCELSRPNASQRLNTAGSGVPSKPPMSWLQNPKPEAARDSPLRSDSDMAAKLDSQSPPQCTGNCCPPAVADRANTTASPSPRSSTSRSKTAWL